MKRIALIILTICLTACSGGCAEVAAVRSGVAEHGADAADQALETAIWTMCSASPVGAIKRRFKTEEERAAYNVICPDGEAP
jgi:hypothetical protein